jgi:hypothetical protein
MASDYAEAWRGGTPVVFELLSQGLPRVGDGVLLRPFLPLHLEAVNEDAVTLSVVGIPQQGRFRPPLEILPGLRYGVTPVRGAATRLHELADKGVVVAAAVAGLVAAHPEFVNSVDAASPGGSEWEPGHGEAARVLWSRFRSAKPRWVDGALLCGKEGPGDSAMFGSAWCGRGGMM